MSQMLKSSGAMGMATLLSRVLGMALAATSYTPIPEPSYGIFRM